MAKRPRSLVEEAFSDLMTMRIDVTRLAGADSAPTLETVKALSDRIGADIQILMRAMNIAKRTLEFGAEEQDNTKEAE